MVLSIRKISTENEDLTGAGALWFPNLNEPDPYLLLPMIATVLNYFNLGVSIFFPALLKLVYSVALQKRTNIGLSIDSGHFSKFSNFSTCLSLISGRQAPLFIGSVHRLSC